MVIRTGVFYSQRSRHGEVVSGLENIVNYKGLTPIFARPSSWRLCASPTDGA